jgi:hypothetical protein
MSFPEGSGLVKNYTCGIPLEHIAHQIPLPLWAEHGAESHSSGFGIDSAYPLTPQTPPVRENPLDFTNREPLCGTSYET